MADSESKWWFQEVWESNRNTVILLAGDGLLFSVLMVSLLIGGYIIELFPFDEAMREQLEAWHFGVIVAAWVLLAVIMGLEIILDAVARGRKRV